MLFRLAVSIFYIFSSGMSLGTSEEWRYLHSKRWSDDQTRFSKSRQKRGKLRVDFDTVRANVWGDWDKYIPLEEYIWFLPQSRVKFRSERFREYVAPVPVTEFTLQQRLCKCTGLFENKLASVSQLILFPTLKVSENVLTAALPCLIRKFSERS